MMENINKIYLINEYKEGDSDDVNIIGAYTSFQKAKAIAKALLLKEWNDMLLEKVAWEATVLAKAAGQGGGIGSKSSDDESIEWDDDVSQYFICTCDFNSDKPKVVNYFEHEITLENPKQNK